MSPTIRRGWIAENEALPAGSSPLLQDTRIQARRRITLFAGIGIAAYVAAMVATMPASVFLKNKPWRTGVAGTVWNGEVGVAGGSVVAWEWAPLRSLTSLGFAVDWTAKGPDTDLGGQALLRGGGVRLDNVSGSADASLLAAVFPKLPFACQLTMQLELPRLRLGGDGQLVEGNATIDPGSCSARAKGAAVPGIASATPAMILTAEHIGTESRIRLAPIGQRRRTLIDATLNEDGGYKVQLTQDGAAMLPFTGLPAGVGIESEL
ncbi:type II secretion system protein N [Sphingomonas sp. S1-29]|uniref:type II secretion system protein N n=1 Tax=Sphingomonas sp. S1-29 TaxID=2991074 RepID=UPI00223EE8B1|nr:type II secretion system protein N [Sphingomonas sp. S1-29]UZK70505.1 type II secretion system protein N [Sphingomonas sp. S1-29]